MDLSKMRVRLDGGKYARVAEMREDFELMMNNCERFNANNQYYWRYGHQMRSLGMKILKNAEQEEQILASVGAAAKRRLLSERSFVFRGNCLTRFCLLW